MLEWDEILWSTEAYNLKKIYSATASGTSLSTNGISNESLQYRMWLNITLPHSVMCHDFCESQQAVTVHFILTL